MENKRTDDGLKRKIEGRGKGRIDRNMLKAKTLGIEKYIFYFLFSCCLISIFMSIYMDTGVQD